MVNLNFNPLLNAINFLVKLAKMGLHKVQDLYIIEMDMHFMVKLKTAGLTKVLRFILTMIFILGNSG